MEKELNELFEAVKKAADAAENSPGEEARCLDALEQLNKFPISYHLLVSTQVGKRLRQLTKHKSHKIKVLASVVVDVWKNIIVKETMKNKNGSVDNDSVKAEPTVAVIDGSRKFQRTSSVKIEQGNSTDNGNGKLKRSNPTSTSNSEKLRKSETSRNGKKVERVDVQTSKNAAGESVQNEKSIKEEKPSSDRQKLASDPVGPPKLTSPVYCKDPVRDKIRELLAEALCKVSSEVDGDDLRDQVCASDPYRVAVLVETAMFEKWGKSTGAQKMKYRSIMFNIKDPKNPDFRRKVLLGQFEPRAILELAPEEMASDARQIQNEKIKQKALFECERGAAPQASTDQFTCGRCKKKETTYYQMQTRSADEPMTTFVTCVNCNNRWKFC
ncbi:transcription elongation factor TFIIS-like [Olea europaea var. sylvestris]|uniref:transcription elongation factor TFIIS-like n=1 Tax=Olea europaea var. sylvestris TaxID=158386 RepID=UPI000C1CD6D2|nr:transcription elongation factor TFIIS-like [Olea europaea var. sylvestris]XP_022890224.1 transcription elongation factor TFIIS-like [Olea europaea var. sylvestris]XP_022890225.1 transcription elongation factor TFIIS-like [Olea europaea var. sylvestris]XP_022890226.1 transcription elongation factor TFIIS-like [Olea europaea var. sylvestris]